MSDYLIGKQVYIRENDFFAHTSEAYVEKLDDSSRALLLELVTPISSKNKTYRYAVASLRLAGDKLESLISKGTLGCSVIWVPDEKYDPSNPMDLSWWRGGGAAITDIYIDYPEK